MLGLKFEEYSANRAANKYIFMCYYMFKYNQRLYTYVYVYKHVLIGMLYEMSIR